MTDGEADDYLFGETHENDIVISNDKDLWPLVIRRVKILLNASTAVDEDLIWQKFKCTPHHIRLYKALVGDPSDKIPGKRGFGPAAWDKLEDRTALSRAFMSGNCKYDTNLMTEQACMSWKLAAPCAKFKYKIIENFENRDPLNFCAEKGIVL
jgi:5'-3' exonuclease